MTNESDADVTINAGIIRKEEYSYLIDSKTVLFVTKPAGPEHRFLSVWIMLVAFAAAYAAAQSESGEVWAFVAGIVGVWAAYYVVKGLISKNTKADDWVLHVGAGEFPIEIFRSNDQFAFADKRQEIEEALTTRPNA